MKFELDERFVEVENEEMMQVEGGKIKFRSKFAKVLSGVLGLHPAIALTVGIKEVIVHSMNK